MTAVTPDAELFDLSDGREYWSIYVDQEGPKTYYETTQLVRPYRGIIVSEQRAGGLFVVLARLGTGLHCPPLLRNAFYVVISHPSSAAHLLFSNYNEALSKWRQRTTAAGVAQIESGLAMLQDAQAKE